MKLIVGLGNPEKKYEHTRHNTGFLIISAFKSRTPDFSDWSFDKKFNAEMSEGIINNEKVLLAKPHTHMNRSGNAVASITHFYKIPPQDVWVIHDDLDLPLGTLRIKTGGSAAGHNGVQSIIDAVGDSFVRFRVGIAGAKKTTAETFVLKRFGLFEKKRFQNICEHTGDALHTALNNGIETAKNQFSS